MLYLVSTPIGNLEDITLRAIKILSNCDYILCEDTRKTLNLLNHLKIKKKLVSFHKFNEKQEEERVIFDLKKKKEIALVSDGGTPIINDPGFVLVKRCYQEKILVTALPGPCSIIDAIVLSGLDSSTFQFIGFLPKQAQKLKLALQQALCFNGLSISLESNRRIIETLTVLQELAPDREVVIARELTKLYEELVHGKPQEVIDHFQKEEPKGEFILLINKGDPNFRDLELEELLFTLKTNYGLSSKEALKMAAKLRKEPKTTIYKQIEC